jgi:exodeoxyribonuclease VIII
MTHVMVDLETLGTVPGCVILSIGAVEFFPETGELGREFYEVISTYDSLECFLSVDKDTEAWWLNQSRDAQRVLELARQPAATKLAVALARFNDYLSAIAPPSHIRLYGNGADFDNPILRVAYSCAKVQPYFKGYGGRCYRQLKNLDELFGPAMAFQKLERQGTHHNALDDAKSQATHLMANVARLKRVIQQAAGE